jgi:transcriptional regulator EpsA
MDMLATKRTQERPLTTWYGAVGTGVCANGEASRSPVPSRSAKIDLPQPAPASYKLSAEENARFLRIVTACAHVRTHYELFVLMQGEMQYFLPQDILIAAWGDFGAQDPQFDVISGLPGVRTNRICNTIIPLPKRLHKIWIDGGSKPIVLDQSVAELEACNNCDRAESCSFPGMKLTMVHGICNRRDGCDSLYVALRRGPFATGATDTRMRFMAEFLIHQIDVAYRKVTALRGANAPSDGRRPSILLSVREEEITYWVCQGKSNGQIAQILSISVNTVKNHVHRIFDKLGASNRTQAVFKYRDMVGRAELSLAGSSQ